MLYDNNRKPSRHKLFNKPVFLLATESFEKFFVKAILMFRFMENIRIIKTLQFSVLSFKP